MDRRFLDYYESELRFLRDLGGEFARAHPGVAGRLALDANACADPYVERLLEGVAFLTARVQLKLDAEFPRLTEHLLDILFPDFLAPTPSMAMVRLVPDVAAGDLAASYRIPAGSRLSSRLGPRMQTRCVFTTAHEVLLFPIELAGVRYLTGSALATANLPARREVKAALTLRLTTLPERPFHQMSLDRLVLHLVAGGRSPWRLYEALLGHGTALLAREPGGAWLPIRDRQPVQRVGFGADEALLPLSRPGFEGYRLLREYFSFPERFLFAALDGLAPAVKAAQGGTLELAVLLDQADRGLDDGIAADDLALFVTPAVNLFEKALEPARLDRQERDAHLVVDRVRPHDYEVHSLLEVSGEGAAGPRRFRPFYALAHPDETGPAGAYYTVERRQRLASAQEARAAGSDRRPGSGGPAAGRARSGYAGGEVFLALVDGGSPPWPEGIDRLHVKARCSNRDLPLLMPLVPGQSHFDVENGPPLAAAYCLGEPTPPRPSLALGEAPPTSSDWTPGETPWQLVSHLALNYLSLVDGPADEGAAALRQLLQLYAAFAEPAVARQVEGLRSVASRPVVDRLPIAGPIAFGRGLEIDLTFDESAFDRGAAFALGGVLEAFLRRHVALNSFTRTVVRTAERGEIMRWPVRLGQRHLA
ncbi:MAG TPA: type VI secretion system baseplate subunit TssF [Geminicoccaceae bacterium]|nr:type VI secretion system baseplate subunit TssF [Geminicoccus sp.]HMU48673.1 type VI secretion system baseplate subunit TssF [Geminicoccaceae bacterium]